MKTSEKNNYVIISFLENSRSHNYTPNLLYVPEGRKLFSYQTCIAQKAENGVIIFNKTRYSNTTSRQQKQLDLCLRQRDVIYIDNVPQGERDLLDYVQKDENRISE